MIKTAVVDDENRICAQLETLLLAIARANMDMDVLHFDNDLCEKPKTRMIV